MSTPLLHSCDYHAVCQQNLLSVNYTVVVLSVNCMLKKSWLKCKFKLVRVISFEHVVQRITLGLYCMLYCTTKMRCWTKAYVY